MNLFVLGISSLLDDCFGWFVLGCLCKGAVLPDGKTDWPFFNGATTVLLVDPSVYLSSCI